jgi:hypothetical protein
MQRQDEIKAWSILTNQAQRAVEEPRLEATNIPSTVTGSFLPPLEGSDPSDRL